MDNGKILADAISQEHAIVVTDRSFKADSKLSTYIIKGRNAYS